MVVEPRVFANIKNSEITNMVLFPAPFLDSVPDHMNEIVARD